MNKMDVLSKYFGYSSFRKGQDALIDAILNGRDVLGILPTGGGKSICYQVPALMLPGLTIVLSPLISLMEDQVEHLAVRGIPAAALTSQRSTGERQAALVDAAQGRIRLLYMSPERLESREFLSFLPKLTISMLAIDEAHCISQWGPEFRPAYRKIPLFLEKLKTLEKPKPRPVVAAFTATATPDVRADIIEAAGLQHPFLLTSGFDRQNLFYEIRRPKNKKQELLDLLKHYRGLTGIVYCETRATVEAVAKFLQQNRIPCAAYHAGLDADVRSKAQEAWLKDEVSIIVATNAFGMGIDKPDVRYVIHYNMPGDPESYYQEAGRAGRDGMPADCILLYSPSDITIIRHFISEASSPELKSVLERRLMAMRSYVTGETCLRASLLSYFGEHAAPFCGRCSVCLKTGPFPAAIPPGVEDPDLYLQLVKIRKKISLRTGKQAYHILSDAALHDLASHRPRTLIDMALMESVGVLHAFRYGREFLDEIKLL